MVIIAGVLLVIASVTVYIMFIGTRDKHLQPSLARKIIFFISLPFLIALGLTIEAIAILIGAIVISFFGWAIKKYFGEPLHR